MTITINHYMIVSLLLFSIGFFGVLVRRNFLTILMSIELMLNAVNLNLIAFSRRLSDLTGPGLLRLRDHDRGRRGRDRARAHDLALPPAQDAERRRSRHDAGLRGDGATAHLARSPRAAGRLPHQRPGLPPVAPDEERPRARPRRMIPRRTATGRPTRCRPSPAATLRRATATGAHAVIPFKALHTAVGVGTVGIACLLAFGAIFDVGLKAFAHGESVTSRPVPLDPARREPGGGRDPGPGAGMGRRRGVPPRRALGAHARLRDLRRISHPRVLGRVHGARGGLRPLLRLPEPLHVLDARPGPGRELPRCSSSGGRAWGSARIS